MSSSPSTTEDPPCRGDDACLICRGSNVRPSCSRMTAQVSFSSKLRKDRRRRIIRIVTCYVGDISGDSTDEKSIGERRQAVERSSKYSRAIFRGKVSSGFYEIREEKLRSVESGRRTAMLYGSWG
ncbi:hypothetical protein TNCV_2117221 [Trichonephila clavipes]|nr:hypothetical protein TNCV_2117221 [Trichonephila clavipes]